jgi:UDP-galactopyranose mutase
MPGWNEVVMFSHLRWWFVWQRPQQIATRFARDSRVFFVEEPRVADVDRPILRS